MRYFDSMNMEEQNNASFRKRDDAKPASVGDEEELQLQDVFNASQISIASSSNASSEESLIRQFNASVSSKALDRSVASFYLEMCDNDLQAAVGFYREQNGTAQRHEAPAKAYTQAPALAVFRSNIPPKRIKSFDVAPIAPRYSTINSPKPRRIKSFDIAEVAVVSAPSVYRNDHLRYPTVKPSPKPVPRNASANIPHRRATQCVVQLPNRRATPWGRSKSERYFQSPPIQGSSSHSSPVRSRSSDSHLHSSMKDLHCDEAAPVTVTRPPSASQGGDCHRARSWEPASPQSGYYNPAA